MPIRPENDPATCPHNITLRLTLPGDAESRLCIDCGARLGGEQR